VWCKYMTCVMYVEKIEGPQAYFASRRNAEGRAASPRSGDDEELVADSPTPFNFLFAGDAFPLLLSYFPKTGDIP